MKRNGFGLLALCLTAIVLTGCLETQSRDLYGLADKTHSAVTADHRFNRPSRLIIALIGGVNGITRCWIRLPTAMWT